MATVDQAACPSCGAPPGSLSITEQLVAKPLGSFSLAGAQMKVSAYTAPVLTCSACGLNRVGSYDADGPHVSFPSSDPTPTGTHHDRDYD